MCVVLMSVCVFGCMCCIICMCCVCVCLYVYVCVYVRVGVCFPLGHVLDLTSSLLFFSSDNSVCDTNTKMGDGAFIALILLFLFDFVRFLIDFWSLFSRFLSFLTGCV